MSTDYTKLLSKIIPARDGADVLTMRTGVVNAINSDGTADVVISGVVVPAVPRLAEASVAVGSVVQMIAYRGSLLIIGRSANGGQSLALGLWARGQNTASSGLQSTTLSGTIATNTVTFVKNRVYEVKTHGGVSSTTANAFLDLRAYRSGPATQIGEFFRFGAPTTGSVYNASGHGIYFTPTVDVVGGVSLYAAGSVASAVTHVAGAGGTPRNVEVYDVGDISQFPGITTW